MRSAALFGILGVGLSAIAVAEGASDSGELLTVSTAGKIASLIRPAEGEALYRNLDWHTDFWEARRIAAREGKPIYIWAGSGGGPVGVC